MKLLLSLTLNRKVCAALALACVAAGPSVVRADSASEEAAVDSEVVLGRDTLTDGVPGSGELTPEEIAAWLSDPENHVPLDVELPKGLDTAAANVFIPEDNPMTRAKIELGRQLYFDPRLSADRSVSCASCHAPDQGFGAHTQFGVGIGGQEGGRNSPFAFNRILSKAQFWDGRAATLEDQAIGPIANPIEMGNTHDACVDSLASIPAYKIQFETIFKDGVTIETSAKRSPLSSGPS